MRRCGYIPGLLFLAACVAAYPLTWGRSVIVTHFTSHDRTDFRLSHGAISIQRTGDAEEFEAWWTERGWVVEAHPNPERESGFPVEIDRYRLGVGCPLWLPALATALCMGWRWRQVRRRLVAVGFPLDGGPARKG